MYFAWCVLAAVKIANKNSLPTVFIPLIYISVSFIRRFGCQQLQTRILSYSTYTYSTFTDKFTLSIAYAK